MKPLAALITTIFLSASAYAADAPANKIDTAKGAASYGGVCMACHGADGNSVVPIQPSLAQQHPEYLFKQLREFKSGARANPVMQGFAASLSEDEMRNMSYWLAEQKAAPGTAKDADTIFLGEKIYRGGIADRKIPACAGCHSPTGAGIPSQYPRLAGQHSEYTEIQLKAFRDGTRANGPMMSGIVKYMNDREIKAVADYMAGMR